MAEGAFREAAIRRGFDCFVDSAGTADYHTGNSPDPRAIATALGHGIAIAGQQARQIELQDFYRFSHVIAMDRANLEGIKARRPRDATAEISLLLDWFDGYQGQGIPDPYYGDETDFLQAWSLIAQATDQVASRIAYLASRAELPFDYPPRNS